MEQTVFNIALSLAGALGAWVLKSVTDTLKEMRQSEHSLRNKVQAIEVQLAGKYISKEDMDRMLNAIFVKLEKIESKLDNKQDKAHT